MRVLGIETSCDDTGVAVYDETLGLMAHGLYSQMALHNRYGGVVPELASRDHIRKLSPLLKEVLAEANLSLKDIDGIAYTKGPGLVGALMVGACFAKGLGLSLNKPCVGVNHMEAHLLAVYLEEAAPSFPFLALIVSGGHSLLVAVKGIGQYEILGETLDDAAGEAFDKTAKLLGLSYPGGPQIARLAEIGDPDRFHFTRPMLNRPGLDFSFSGLKTVVSTTWQTSDQSDQTKADIARAFQDAVVETLLVKTQRALVQTGYQCLVIAGGVGANRALREGLSQFMSSIGGTVYYPRPAFCVDNGAMVAYAGYQHLRQGADPDWQISVRARWPLDESINS